ncbi:hypothetical protein ABID08_004023 [Rhizobium binae]|uniref:KTSC domain-containing protein n=2 Tax=Rhizobium binae TaxID=1138190 RepID=A0ABV2MJL4_9HYPH
MIRAFGASDLPTGCAGKKENDGRGRYYRWGMAMTLETSGQTSEPDEFVFPVHTRTIAQIRYDIVGQVMTVVYHDGRSRTSTGIQGPAMLRILAQRPLERSPFLLRTVI